MKDKEFHWQLITFFRVLFAFHLIYSGAAYVFFGWVPSAFHNPASPVGRFMVELDSVGLYPLVKYIELFLGVLVLSNRFVAVAAVAELPITIIISYLNIFVEGAIDARHYYTGVQELTSTEWCCWGMAPIIARCLPHDRDRNGCGNAWIRTQPQMDRPRAR